MNHLFDQRVYSDNEYAYKKCINCVGQANMYLRFKDLPNEVRFELENINYSNPYEMYDLLSKLAKRKSNNIEWRENLEYIKLINIIMSKMHSYNTFKMRLSLGKL